MKITSNHINTIIFSLFCTFFLISCSNEKKTTSVHANFVNALSSLMVIENLDVPDSTKAQLTKRTLDENNLSMNDIRRIREKYAKNTDFWTEVYKQVQLKTKEASSQLSKKLRSSNKANFEKQNTRRQKVIRKKP